MVKDNSCLKYSYMPPPFVGKAIDWDPDCDEPLKCIECIECCDEPNVKVGDDWGFEQNLICYKCGRKIKEVSPRAYYMFQKLQRCYSNEPCCIEK